MERTPSPRPEGRRDSSQPAGQGDQSQSHDAEALERKRRESTRFFESVPGSSVPLAGSSRGDGQSHTPEREEGPLTKRRRLGTWQSGGLFGTQSEGQYTLGSVPVEAFSSSRSQEHVDPQTEKDLEFILRENILKNVTSDDASDLYKLLLKAKNSERVIKNPSDDTTEFRKISRRRGEKVKRTLDEFEPDTQQKLRDIQSKIPDMMSDTSKVRRFLRKEPYEPLPEDIKPKDIKKAVEQLRQDLPTLRRVINIGKRDIIGEFLLKLGPNKYELSPEDTSNYPQEAIASGEQIYDEVSEERFGKDDEIRRMGRIDIRAQLRLSSYKDNQEIIAAMGAYIDTMAYSTGQVNSEASVKAWKELAVKAKSDGDTDMMSIMEDSMQKTRERINRESSQSFNRFAPSKHLGGLHREF